MLHPFFLLCLGLLASSQVLAQNNGFLKPDRPLRIIVFHETNQLSPGLRFGDQDLHPGIMVGTEWKLNQNPRADIFLTANLGGYHHRLLSSGVFVNSEIGYRYRSSMGIFAQASLGLGYLHVFYPGEVYEFDESANRFQPATNDGHPALLASLGLALGYKIGTTPKAPELFISYQYAPELPFSLTGLHQLLGVGVTFFPF